MRIHEWLIWGKNMEWSQKLNPFIMEEDFILLMNLIHYSLNLRKNSRILNIQLGINTSEMILNHQK